MSMGRQWIAKQRYRDILNLFWAVDVPGLWEWLRRATVSHGFNLWFVWLTNLGHQPPVSSFRTVVSRFLFRMQSWRKMTKLSQLYKLCIKIYNEYKYSVLIITWQAVMASLGTKVSLVGWYRISCLYNVLWYSSLTSTYHNSETCVVFIN